MSEGHIYGRPVTEWCTPPAPSVVSRKLKTGLEGTKTNYAEVSTHQDANIIERNSSLVTSPSYVPLKQLYTISSPSPSTPSGLTSANMEWQKFTTQGRLSPALCDPCVTTAVVHGHQSQHVNEINNMHVLSNVHGRTALHPTFDKQTDSQTLQVPMPIRDMYSTQHGSESIYSQTNYQSREQRRDLFHNPTAPRIGSKSMSKSVDNVHIKLTPTAKVAPLMEARNITKPSSFTSQQDFSQDPKNEMCKDVKAAHESHNVLTGDVLGTVDKWKVLIETKDRILTQKDELIKRQRQSLSYLKDQVKEWESQYHQLLSSKANEEGGSVLNAKLKELEYRNSSLKAEFSETLVAKNAEVARLSKRLDEAEYQLHSSALDKRDRVKTFVSEIETLEAQVKSRDDSLKDLEKTLSEAVSNNAKLNKRMTELNAYLGDMPTMEEHHALLDQVNKLGSKCELLTSKLADTEEQLQRTTILLKQKEDERFGLETRIAEISCELKEMKLETTSQQGDKVAQQEKETLLTECQKLKNLLFESENRCRRELQAMRERHKQRFLDVTSELRVRHKALAKRAKALELQLIKNTDTMTALSSELRVSQGAVGELKSSIKQVLSENQKLVEKNISLQEASSEETRSSKQLEESHSSLLQQISSELSHCISDFESLIQLSSSIVEGHFPATATAIGVTGGHHVMRMEEAEISSDISFEEKLHQVQQLRSKVDQLRDTVSDQFATQVCTNCQVQ